MKTDAMTNQRLKSMADSFERPVALLALLVVPALMLEDRASTPGPCAAHTRGLLQRTKVVEGALL